MELSPQEFVNAILQARLAQLFLDETVWVKNRLFWWGGTITPWPWYKRWIWRYWTRPWGAVRHSICCGNDHDGY